MKKLKIFNDPIYGFIAIETPLIFQLIEHPYFQRLRRIAQMGLSSLVYPGAHHTRFEHALGAMHIMQRAIVVLRAKGVAISEAESGGETGAQDAGFSDADGCHSSGCEFGERVSWPGA